MYTYKAIITSVYDGDTVTADVDLGFRSHLKKLKFRLYGIDAPEVRGEERPEGLKARDWLRERILGKEVTIRSVKDRTGKYGRWLAHVYVSAGDDMSVNLEMAQLGLAEEREY